MKRDVRQLRGYLKDARFMNRRMFLIAGGSMLAAQTGSVGPGQSGRDRRRQPRHVRDGVFQKDPALRVGAICDVYEPNLERGISTASKVAGDHPKHVSQLQRTAGG